MFTRLLSPVRNLARAPLLVSKPALVQPLKPLKPLAMMFHSSPAILAIVPKERKSRRRKKLRTQQLFMKKGADSHITSFLSLQTE